MTSDIDTIRKKVFSHKFDGGHRIELHQLRAGDWSFQGEGYEGDRLFLYKDQVKELKRFLNKELLQEIEQEFDRLMKPIRKKEDCWKVANKLKQFLSKYHSQTGKEAEVGQPKSCHKNLSDTTSEQVGVEMGKVSNSENPASESGCGDSFHNPDGSTKICGKYRFKCPSCRKLLDNSEVNKA